VASPTSNILLLTYLGADWRYCISLEAECTQVTWLRNNFLSLTSVSNFGSIVMLWTAKLEILHLSWIVSIAKLRLHLG